MKMTSENEDYDQWMAQIHCNVQEEKWKNHPIVCKDCKKRLEFYSSEPWKYCPFCACKIETTKIDAMI